MTMSACDPHYWKALVGALCKSMDLMAPRLNQEGKKMGVSIN